MKTSLVKKIAVLTGILFITTAWGQTEIRKSSLAPGGETATNGTVEVISTAGEIFVQELNPNGILLSEGFIGPDLSATLKVENYTGFAGVRVFPNPVPDKLEVYLNEDHTCRLYLYDGGGQEIYRWNMQGNHGTFDLHELQPGVYFLIVIDDENRQKTVIRIQKN